MAFAHYPLAVPVEPCEYPKLPISNPPLSISSHCLNLSSTFRPKTHNPSLFPRLRRIAHKAKAKPQEPEVSVASDAFTEFKHLLLPITDRNPYLSEGTKQAIATTSALAKKYGADITVVVIDEQQKESLPEHEAQLSSIRWHLSEGGLKDYNLLERLGEGSKPTAIIGDVADDLNLDLVVISMEAIHTKHIDANLLAEFIPCPVMLLPL
ncbi:Rossmann-like alpha/beta/alpha sandwich fold [Vigna unguiculata]|uniref:Rossmann-like alpha/beta/alpha sandwich fold n=1 Tax=Vigna unguiculata TaxID=3917 RepID=A0A4D6KYG5_VIGUN|nr:Rossmann-like alpha/beta/alpha sandwich fold [Vigna unguiculata]